MIDAADDGDKGQRYQTLIPHRIFQCLIRDTKRQKVATEMEQEEKER